MKWTPSPTTSPGIVRTPERMPENAATQQTLEALRNARTTEEIVGRERLAEAQNRLVDLLSAR